MTPSTQLATPRLVWTNQVSLTFVSCLAAHFSRVVFFIILACFMAKGIIISIRHFQYIPKDKIQICSILLSVLSLDFVVAADLKTFDWKNLSLQDFIKTRVSTQFHLKCWFRVRISKNICSENHNAWHQQLDRCMETFTKTMSIKACDLVLINSIWPWNLFNYSFLFFNVWLENVSLIVISIGIGISMKYYKVEVRLKNSPNCCKKQTEKQKSRRLMEKRRHWTLSVPIQGTGTVWSIYKSCKISITLMQVAKKKI